MYLKSNNLHVRPANENDAQILCHWWSDGKIMAHAGFPNGVETDINELIDKLRKETDKARRLIIEIDSNKVGEMSYRIEKDIAEIGIKICDFSYQEKGYGTKAIRMLIRYLFDDMKVTKVILDTNLNNTRAQHVYESIGFVKTNVRMDSWKDQLGILQSTVEYELFSDNIKWGMDYDKEN